MVLRNSDNRTCTSEKKSPTTKHGYVLFDNQTHWFPKQSSHQFRFMADAVIRYTNTASTFENAFFRQDSVHHKF